MLIQLLPGDRVEIPRRLLCQVRDFGADSSHFEAVREGPQGMAVVLLPRFAQANDANAQLHERCFGSAES